MTHQALAEHHISELPASLWQDGEPCVYSERNDDFDTEGYVDQMEFRLVYQGALPGSGNSSRHPQDKHRIRKVLHKQLAIQWATHPLLKHFQAGFSMPGSGTKVGETFLDKWAKDMHGFRFLSLVNERFDQVCSLDILILRRERPGNLIMQGGDIDNRVKTLFDALSIPKSNSGLTPPEPDELPFYCVLEEDKLVNQVSVTADRLLVPPEGPEPQNYVHAVIKAKIQVSSEFYWGARYYRRNG